MVRTVEFQIIDLRGRVRGVAGVEFLRAEIPTGVFQSPFVVVRYSLYGEEQPYGLRLDLDKGVFLDHFDDEREMALKAAEDQIIDIVNDAISRNEYREDPSHAFERVIDEEEENEEEGLAARNWLRDAGHMSHAGREKVFISGSNKDLEWGRLFYSYLENHLHEQVAISEARWLDDTRFGHDERWQRHLEAALETSKVIILLISSNFIASKFVTTNILPALLEGAQREGASILCVLIDSVPVNRLKWMDEFQWVNSRNSPLRLLPQSQQKQILEEVTDIVEESIQS